jgi:hypothetical protein
VERAETILLPRFDAWRTRGLSNITPRVPARGTFDWMVAIYRNSPQYQGLSKRMKINYEYGLGIASNHPLKRDSNGRTRVGQLSLAEVTSGIADRLYSKVKADREPVLNANGTPVIGRNGNIEQQEIPRLRRGQEVMKACRRAWNVARRHAPRLIPHVNPFERAEVEAPKSGKTMPADWEQTMEFVKACDESGDWSIGTAALVSFCWFQREEHIMGVPREDGRTTGLRLADYRPALNTVLIRHPKTNETVELPLYAADGRPLFPELMLRLDNAPRRGTLICMSACVTGPMQRECIDHGRRGATMRRSPPSSGAWPQSGARWGCRRRSPSAPSVMAVYSRRRWVPRPTRPSISIAREQWPSGSAREQGC